MNNVKIQGIAYPVKFSLNTKRLFCRQKGIELFEMEQMFSKVTKDVSIDDIENLGLFILTAIQEGHRKQGLKCGLILDDIIEVMGDDPSFIAEVMDIYTFSEVPKTGETGDEKKK